MGNQAAESEEKPGNREVKRTNPEASCVASGRKQERKTR